MRIGELAARAGVSVRALRYYEEQGLLHSERTAGGQRDYDASAVERVGFFQVMYAAGLSSKRIAEMLPCIDSGTTDVDQRRMLEDEHRRIESRIDELIDVRDRLKVIIAAASDRAA